MNELNIKKVEACMSWLMEGESFTHSQSVSYLIDKLGELSVSMAFVNNQMAIAKKVLNDAKVKSYMSYGVKQNKLSPMLTKDLINSQVAPEQYDYDLCERCSRTIVHTIDALRTAVSALKAEMQYAGIG